MRIFYRRSGGKVHATCVFDHGAIAVRAIPKAKNEVARVFIDDNTERAVVLLELISDGSISFKISLEAILSKAAQGSQEFHLSVERGHLKIHVTGDDTKEAVRILQALCDLSVDFSTSLNAIITKVARQCLSANVNGSHLKLLASK